MENKQAQRCSNKIQLQTCLLDGEFKSQPMLQILKIQEIFADKPTKSTMTAKPSTFTTEPRQYRCKNTQDYEDEKCEIDMFLVKDECKNRFERVNRQNKNKTTTQEEETLEQIAYLMKKINDLKKKNEEEECDEKKTTFDCLIKEQKTQKKQKLVDEILCQMKETQTNKYEDEFETMTGFFGKKPQQQHQPKEENIYFEMTPETMKMFTTQKMANKCDIQEKMTMIECIEEEVKRQEKQQKKHQLKQLENHIRQLEQELDEECQRNSFNLAEIKKHVEMKQELKQMKKHIQNKLEECELMETCEKQQKVQKICKHLKQIEDLIEQECEKTHKKCQEQEQKEAKYQQIKEQLEFIRKQNKKHCQTETEQDEQDNEYERKRELKQKLQKLMQQFEQLKFSCQ